jgi:hypothetical protein
MAQKRGIRLPLWRFPCTTGGMRKWLKKFDIPVEEYLTANNEKNLKHFNQMNPAWPLRAWVCLQMEWLEWRNQPVVSFERVKRKRGRPKKEIKENE